MHEAAAYRVSRVRVDHHVRGDVVQTDRLVVAAREQLRRREEVHGMHRRAVRLRLAEHRLRLHVEQLDVALLVARRQKLPVVTEIACFEDHSQIYRNTRYP